MNEEAIDHLENIYEEDREFDISRVLSRGFNIWKEEFMSFTLFGFVFFLSSLTMQTMGSIGSLVNSLLISPAFVLGAGIYAYRSYSKEEKEFNNFLDGFAHWKQLIIVNVVLSFGVLFLLIPFMMTYGLDTIADTAKLATIDFSSIDVSTSEMVMIAGAVFLLIFLGVCLAYTSFFIGFFELEAIDAIKYSYRFVIRNWFSVFIAILLAGLISVSGILALVLGVLLTFPMIFAYQFAAFEELTAVSEYYDKQESKIGPEESKYFD